MWTIWSSCARQVNYPFVCNICTILCFISNLPQTFGFWIHEVTFVGPEIVASLTLISLDVIISGSCSLSHVLVTSNGNSSMNKGIGYSTCLRLLCTNISGFERGDKNSWSLSSLDYQTTCNNEMLSSSCQHFHLTSEVRKNQLFPKSKVTDSGAKHLLQSNCTSKYTWSYK